MTAEEFDAQAMDVIPEIMDRTDSGLRLDPVLGDTATSAVADLQGFNGFPLVVDDAGLTALIDQGWTEVWRGIAAETESQFVDFAAMLTSAETPYFGPGLYGNGTYVTDGRSIAEMFASGEATGLGGAKDVLRGAGDVVRIALSPEARVISSEQITALVEAETTRIAALDARLDSLIASAQAPHQATIDRLMSEAESAYMAAHPEARFPSSFAVREFAFTDEMRREYEAASAFMQYGSPEFRSLYTSEMTAIETQRSVGNFLTQDLGRFASSRGYDAIYEAKPYGGMDMTTGEIKTVPAAYWNILNRTALAIRSVP